MACAEMSLVAAAHTAQLILATAYLSVDMPQHATYVPLEPRRDRLGQLAQPGQIHRLWEGRSMGYGIVHQFQGGTKEQYEASIAAVHPADGSLPAGQVFHAAGPSADGWTIVAVHDSQGSWETFRDSILLPRMQAGIEGGFGSLPLESRFEVATEIRA
jgi:hypothetical protein